MHEVAGKVRSKNADLRLVIERLQLGDAHANARAAQLSIYGRHIQFFLLGLLGLLSKRDADEGERPVLLVQVHPFARCAHQRFECLQLSEVSS